MAWDNSKSQFQAQSGVPVDEKLTASEWNNHVTDQQNRGYNDLSSVTSDYTASPQEIVLADASGGAITVTLPAAESAACVVIKKTDSSANNVTVATPNSETIDGSSTVTLSSQYAREEITSDGTDYFLIT